MSISTNISRAIGGLFASIRMRLERRFNRTMKDEAKGVSATSGSSEAIRRSPVMASLFPCLYNKTHGHPVGRPHTCNSFLLAPNTFKVKGANRKSSYTIVVSHWAAHRHGRRAAA